MFSICSFGAPIINALIIVLISCCIQNLDYPNGTERSICLIKSFSTVEAHTVMMASEASASSSVKKERKRVVLSIEDKVKILELVDKSVS